MEEIEKLYNVLIDKKLYSKSLEEFEEQFSDPEYVDKVYNVVTDRKLYSKDKETFTNQYSSKKKIEDEPMDSPSGDGGSDLSEDQDLQTGREIDTLSIQIANLENQIKEDIEQLSETPMTTDEIITTPAVETPEMLELESLKKKRDELIESTKKPGDELFDNTNIDEQKRKVGEIVSTDMELSRVNTSSPEYKDMVELLDRSESFVVPKLNYLYGDQGFKFEEADILGQKIKVTAKNGEKQRVNIGIGQNEEKRALELLEFIEKNKEASQALAKTVVGYEANQIKFRNDKVMDDAMSAFSKREDRFNKAAQLYSANSLRFEQEINDIESMTPEQVTDLNNRIAIHNAAGAKLLEEEKNLKARQAQLNEAVGKYYDMQEQQGSFGLLMKYKGASGVLGPIAELVGYGIQTGVNLLPIDLQKQMGEERYKNEILNAAEKQGLPLPSEEDIKDITIDELKEFYRSDAGTKTIPGGVGAPGTTVKLTDYDKLVDEVRDVYAKDLKYGKMVDGKREGGVVTMIREDLLEEVAGKSITEQYAAVQQENFWIGALAGLAESIPSIAAGPARLASLFLLTSGKLDEEMMKNPEFAGISENEKAIFKMPVAFIAAQLENFGIRNVFDKGGLVANILTRVLNRMPKGGSARTFKEFVDQEVKSAAARGGLVLAGATLAEAETGALQEVNDIFSKKLYNQIKDKELFSTPKGFTEIIGQVAYSAAQEAVGGLVLGTMPAVSAAVNENKFANLSEQQIQIFREIKNNPTISQKALTNKIKMDINGGEITAEQGKQIKADYELAIGLANELPGGIDNPAFAEAMDLKIRKKVLEDRTDGLDPNLGSVKQDNLEIQQINERLAQIKETTTDTQIEGATQQETKDITEVVEQAESAAPPVQETKESATDIFFGKKKTKNVEEISDNLIINTNEQPENLKPNQVTLRNVVKGLAKTGAQAIQKLFPETKIILHESTTEFERFAPANNRGFYDTNENVIHIDLNKALATTVPHEIFHATLLNKIKTDAEAAKLAENMMRSVRKALPKNSPLARRIDEFAAKYEDQPDFQNEERLAELMGIMASEYTQLTKPQKNKVIKFLQDLANKIGLNINFSEFTQQDSDVVDLFNTLAGKVATGEAITETDIEAFNLNQEEPGPIGPPVKLKKPKGRQQVVDFKASYPLSLINESNKIDIDALINDIISKDQTVTFWVADQLGVGEVNGMPIDGGPSFPFAQEGNVVWASGKSLKALEQQLKGDYIFIISGSPTRSKLFNKSVYDIYVSKLGDYASFKEAAMLTKPVQSIKTVLDSFDSWESLRESPERKTFLNGIADQLLKPNTEFHKYMVSIDGFVNAQDLRDGFYKENDFKQNDIMLVYKYTGTKEGSKHSTYANEVLGEVIGVPDKIINAADIIDVPSKSVEGKPRSVQSQVVAPYGLGKKKLKPREQREKTIQEVAQFYNVDTAGFANPMVDEFQFRKAAEELGYGVARARSGSLYLTKNGKFINPYITGRAQRSDDFYVDIANQLRDRKVREELIVDTLRRQYKLSETKIKDILDIQSLTLGAVPDSFKKIGDAAGLKLFLDLETFILKQRKANKKKPLSKTAEADSVINYLMERPQFKKLAETYKVKGETKTKKGLSTLQAQMLSDLTSILEARPSQTVTAQIVKARQSIRDKKKGATTVKSQQQILINLLRRNLPKSLFTKSEVIEIVRKIQDLSTADLKGNNLENIVDEIEGIVTKLNNRNVLNRIKKILKGKYEVTVSGRPKGVKVDVETKNRLKTIASLLVADDAPVEVVEKTQEKLRAELESLLESDNDTKKEELTPETLMRIADITTALNYNEAMLQDPSDISRLENLTRAYVQLENIVVRGRDIQAGILQEKHKTYLKNLSILIKETLNEDLNPNDENFKKEVDDISDTRYAIREKEKVDKNVVNFFRRKLRDFNSTLGFTAAQDLTGLIDQLAEFPGVVFGGQLQEIVTDKVNESTRQYKSRMLDFSLLLDENLTKYFGKNYRLILKNLNQTDNFFYKNAKEVQQAKDNYDKNRNSETKRKLRDVLLKNEIVLSQQQMGYMVFQYKDPALHPTFKNMYGDQYQRIMKEMNEQLDDRIRAFGEWQVNEFYPVMHQRFNETYKRIYYTDMPFNKYYAGPLRREGVEPEEFDILKGSSKYNATVGSNYTKLRVNSKDKIENSTLLDAMMNYTEDMEYFDAYAENIQTISRLFTNKDAKIIIESIHGEKFYKLIDNMINKIATAGKSKSNMFAAQTFNFFNNVFQISRLMLSPAIAIKQLTSIPTFALEPEVGPVNWFKYAAKNKSQQLKVYNEVINNSVYLKDRADKSILRSIETYSPERYSNFVPKSSQNAAIDILMGLIKVADRSAILMGGLPNYSFYKAKFQKENPNATEQQAIDYAIRKFEKDVKSTQQSYDLQDRDIHQNRDPFSRGLNMFLTTPKQYLRREITGWRQMTRASKRFFKGETNKYAPNGLQAFSQFAFYHAFMPVLFQYTSLGFPGLARDRRDDDEETLMRALVMGNLNALFFIGLLIQQGFDAYADKPWFRDIVSIPAAEVARDFFVILNKLTKADTQTKKDEVYKDMFEFINRNGLPYSIIERWVKNLQKVINGETDGAGENILRILNFSEYAISGPEKKAKKLKFGSSKKKSKGLDFNFDTNLNFELDTDFDTDI